MSGFKSVLAAATVILTCLALSALKMTPAQADCINSQSPDWSAWQGSYESSTHTTLIGGVRYFDSVQGFYWCYTSTPFLGDVEEIDVTNDNVQNVSYDPAYFFPSQNAGTVEIHWQGRLTSNSSNGSLKTLGEIGIAPHYSSDDRTITVLNF